MKARLPPSCLAPLFLLLTLATGCSLRSESWEDAPTLPDSAVRILTASGTTPSESQRAATAILRKAFPGATAQSLEQFVTAGPTLRRDGVVLIVPNVRELSPETWIALTNHIARGGLTLFWGLDPAQAPGNAACEMLRPATEFYSFSTRTLSGIPAGQLTSAKPVLMQSPFLRPTGIGGTSAAQQRWIPLAEAHGAGDVVQGWPASLRIAMSENAPLRAWGWIGWDPDAAHATTQRALLQTAAARLHQRQFLLRAGLDRHALETNEPINIAAQIAVAPASRGPWRVAAEMENEQGAVARRVAETLAPDAPVSLVSTTLFLGASARRIDQPTRALLRIALLDSVTGQTLDTIRQPLRLRPESSAARAADDERIGTRGSSFTLGRRPVSLIGLRYSSRAAAPYRNALDPAIFDFALLRSDLRRFRDASVNTIVIPYPDLAYAPQLRILLDELRAYSIWGLIELPALSPWNPDWARAAEQLAALQLAPRHRILAISPGRIAPPRAGEETDRLNAAWAQWIVEQYGSTEHAAARLGTDPQTISPASLWNRDAEFPPPLRIAARRFLDDFIARHYRDCRTLLRESGWTGLFTAPAGTTLDPAAGVYLLDFVSLDAAALDPDDPDRTAFYTAYARAVSAGKPVLWLNLSSAMPYPPSRDDLHTQAGHLDASLRAVIRAHAAGVVLSAFFGGPLGPDQTDSGLITPDGAWRPGGEVFRSRIQDWRHEQFSIPPWRGLEVDTVNAPDGLPGLYAHTQTSASADPLAEMRPIGWDRFSTETPLVSLAGDPLDAPEPLKFFNAQWMLSPESRTNLNARQPVQLELLNTGLARWSPSVTGVVGAVWISAERSGARPLILPIRETPPGERARAAWIPGDSGTWTLRPFVFPDTPFGEPLHIEIK